MRLSVTVREACEMSGLGVTTLYKKMSEGALDTVKVGRRRLIKVASLEAMLGAGR